MLPGTPTNGRSQYENVMELHSCPPSRQLTEWGCWVRLTGEPDPLIPKSEAAARATQPGGLISNHKVAAARSGPGGQWTWKSLSELLGQERRCQFVDALIRANK